MNIMRTTMLLAAMTALFMGVGYMMGGPVGMGIALIVAICMNFFSFYNGDKMVLSMHGAREVNRQSAPEYYDLVAKLAQKADLPMPRVFILENPQPNAFATGRNPDNSAVAASTGLLKMLNRDEIEGVIAHELAHIKHRDILTMTLTATFAGAISMVANFGFFFGHRNSPFGFIGVIVAMIVAPLAAMMVQMAISRTREYSADRGGALISGKPLALASALAKISSGAEHIVNEDAEKNPATAHMFIINPLSGQNMDGLFSTHPNPQNRIAALQALAKEMHNLPNQQSSETKTDESHDDMTNQGPWGQRVNEPNKSKARVPQSGTQQKWGRQVRDEKSSFKGPWQ